MATPIYTAAQIRVKDIQLKTMLLLNNSSMQFHFKALVIFVPPKKLCTINKSAVTPDDSVTHYSSFLLFHSL
jgi:hypothetical protein